ncbi:MAG: ribose-5-phosphate isomerase A [Erysipelotrichaceae bacterium]|nr:ribose-5-phosphate isomerase A [Erysipelotrichaceae bacterium]
MERHAAEAAANLIRDYMTIGLGSGKGIEYLIEFIAAKNLDGLKIVTSSMATALKAKQRDLEVVPTWMVDHTDFTFDSVDFADRDLNSAKSDAQMIVENKLLASMADRFVLIVSKDSFNTVLTDGLPVQVEVVKPAFSYVTKRLAEMGASVHAVNTAYGEPFVSAQGNCLLYAVFKTYNSIDDLNLAIRTIPGTVDTSLFTGLNATAVVYDGYGVEIIEKH